MKILHYVDCDSMSWEVAYIEHIKKLEQCGIECVLMCRPEGTLAALANSNNTKTFTWRPLIASMPFLSPGFIKIIKDISPDIIHTRLSSAANIAGFWRSVNLEIPVINTFDKPARAKYYKHADRYISCAEWLKRYMSEREGLAPEKIDVIYNPVDNKRYHCDDIKYKKSREALNIAEDEIIFSGMGIYIYRKGFDVLIKAFARVCAACGKKMRLMLIGGEGEAGRREEYLSLARELGVDDKLIMPDSFVSDVREWLWASDIFVMPSREEGFSIALLEGMAAGVPVIVSDIEPFTEIIKDNYNGLVAVKDNPESFADKMLEMLNMNLSGRKAMASKALELVNRECTPEAAVEKTLSVYESVLYNFKK